MHVGWSIAVVPGLFNFIQCAVSTRLDSVVGVGIIFKYSYFALDTNKFVLIKDGIRVPFKIIFQSFLCPKL